MRGKRRAKFLALTLVFLMCVSGCAAKSETSKSLKEKEKLEVETKKNMDVQTPEVKQGATPVATHGALHVEGCDLVGSQGEKVQLYGMSTHGIAWYPQYVCEETFTALRDEWNTNCIRLAMYTYEDHGYCTDGDKEEIKALVKKGVDLATDLGMYVIIDWHILNEKSPLVYEEEAKAFFQEMSSTYADYDNVLYEICNEPNSGPSWQDVKDYANEIIPIIRANDEDAVIIVGTTTWSQDIQDALADPLDYDNLMYTLHFYAATHKDDLRNRLVECHEKGLPVYVSEFGICDASGNGGLDYASAEAWMDLIDEYNLSFQCWNLANKNESSSVFKEDCTKLSGWEDADMNDQGIWIKDVFLKHTSK